MTTLADTVTINRRFARSARIDRDLGGTPPLVGYVMQASVAKALSTLACSQVETLQGAFTWTGPYGGGKSCAALLLANLVGGSGENRKIARDIAGDELVALYEEAFPPADGGWAVLAVTGSRGSLREAIAAAAQASLGWTDVEMAKASSSDAALIGAIESAAARRPTLLILDELGKLLEFAALHGGDVHLLQDLAERSARSEGRLAVLGILHQAFDQYAARAAREARREWAKVQGRFQDIPFLSGPDETVALLGRAIGCAKRPRQASATAAAAAAASQVARHRPTEERALAKALTLTWPLNPVTALLLGPVSRQRFAQNERSVFGFLGSSEPAGFQEHLSTTPAGEARTYGPDRLWDYLSTNFGMALAGGQDGAKFSLAFEAIDRAGAKGGPLHVALTKSAAMIEFFRNGSGLAVSDEILALSVPGASPDELSKAVADLLDWAILMRQPRLGGYALFAGSDFDLDEAIARAAAPLGRGELNPMPQRVGLGSVAAKRHYFRTGALRTFEIVADVPNRDEKVADAAARLASHDVRGSGLVVLLVGDDTFDAPEVEVRCRLMAKALREAGIVAAVGAAPVRRDLIGAATELFAIERVMRDNPRLEGDRIARREIAARHASGVDGLHRQIDAALNDAKWWLTTKDRAVRQPLTVLASELADTAFDCSPILHSELLQRERPSSSAAAALRNLCHAMVGKPNEPNLGFEGFPAEMGLYLTVLQPFGLHREEGGELDFHPPADDERGRSLGGAWAALEDAPDLRLDELYATWAATPFGMKAGIMPVIALASLMARRDRVAVYIDDVFQTSFDDVLVDKLLQRPEAVRIRRIDRSLQEAAYLSGLATLLELPVSAAALPVAQALYRRFENLPAYAQRTSTLPAEARAVRDAVLRSDDPETLLFERIPEALGGQLSAEAVHSALVTTEAAYGELLQRIVRALARGLGVDATTFEGLAERAAAVRDLTNDYAFEAYAMRAAAFDGGDGDIEGLASLLLHKPPRSWSDRDADQALLELGALARRFRETEALAIVRDRSSSTEAMALVVGLDPKVPPVLRSFVLTAGEREAATALSDRLLAMLVEGDTLPNVQLAALARAVADIAIDTDAETGVAEAVAA